MILRRQHEVCRLAESFPFAKAQLKMKACRPASLKAYAEITIQAQAFVDAKHVAQHITGDYLFPAHWLHTAVAVSPLKTPGLLAIPGARIVSRVIPVGERRNVCPLRDVFSAGISATQNRYFSELEYLFLCYICWKLTYPQQHCGLDD